MSGLDESKPRCLNCTVELRDGLDTRRLIARNIEGVMLLVLTSDFDENKTGVRVMFYDVSEDVNKVIAQSYCDNCGYKTDGQSMIQAMKKYVWLYKGSFGASQEIFDELRRTAMEENYPRSINIPEYDEYTGEYDDGDYCSDCGEEMDGCTCNTCPDCGYALDECVCCPHCGGDSQYCDCICPECGDEKRHCGCWCPDCEELRTECVCNNCSDCGLNLDECECQ